MSEDVEIVDGLLCERAKAAVARAKRDGTLTQRPCSCGNPKSEAHHHKGYAPEHWLDVEWLCKKCHAAAHLAGPKRRRTKIEGRGHERFNWSVAPRVLRMADVRAEETGETRSGYIARLIREDWARLKRREDDERLTKESDDGT